MFPNRSLTLKCATWALDGRTRVFLSLGFWSICLTVETRIEESCMYLWRWWWLEIRQQILASADDHNLSSAWNNFHKLCLDFLSDQSWPPYHKREGMSGFSDLNDSVSVKGKLQHSVEQMWHTLQFLDGRQKQGRAQRRVHRTCESLQQSNGDLFLLYC